MESHTLITDISEARSAKRSQHQKNLNLLYADAFAELAEACYRIADGILKEGMHSDT